MEPRGSRKAASEQIRNLTFKRAFSTHHALAYHYTREAVASKMVSFNHIDGAANAADILSKHWGHNQVYPMLRPILFYEGNTLDLIETEG